MHLHKQQMQVELQVVHKEKIIKLEIKKLQVNKQHQQLQDYLH
jgi:hypothetical protein